MIVRLTGTLIEVNEESIVVDRDGVAREVLVPHFAISELAAYRGQLVTLHTIQFYEGNHASGHFDFDMQRILRPADPVVLRHANRGRVPILRVRRGHKARETPQRDGRDEARSGLHHVRHHAGFVDVFQILNSEF